MPKTPALSPDALFAARFLARVPPDVAASFTPAQLRAVQASFGMRYAMDHAIDLRRRVLLPWMGGIYVVLLAGRDRRGGDDTRRAPGGPAWRGLLALLGGIALLAGLGALPAGAFGPFG